MSFLDGMSEQKGALLLQSLLAEVSVNLSEPDYLKDGSRELVSDFLEPDEYDTVNKNPFNEPEIQGLLKYLGVTDNSKNTLLFSLSNMESVDISASWSKLKELGDDGLGVIGALRKSGDQNFAYFISKVSYLPLETMLKTCTEELNFKDSDKKESLYSVSIGYNCIRALIEERPGCHGYHLSDDLRLSDSFYTCSLAEIFTNPLESMKFAIERLRGMWMEKLDTTFLNTSVLTKLIVHGNGSLILEIPLVNDLASDSRSIESLDMEHRKAINSKGVQGYQLDLDGLVCGGGTSQDLREIAKFFPRKVALKLRGAALEDSLGL
jgi:hypothetical protein